MNRILLLSDILFITSWLTGSEHGKADYGTSKIVAHADKVSYHQVITKVTLSPSWRKRRATEEDRPREREKDGRRRRKCQTAWPFLGNLTTMSVWDTNLQSSLDRIHTLICPFHLSFTLISCPFLISLLSVHFWWLATHCHYFNCPCSFDIYSVSIWLFLIFIFFSQMLNCWSHYPLPGHLSSICILPSVCLVHSSTQWQTRTHAHTQTAQYGPHITAIKLSIPL